jgi:hypothetical protein
MAATSASAAAAAPGEFLDGVENKGNKKEKSVLGSLGVRGPLPAAPYRPLHRPDRHPSHAGRPAHRFTRRLWGCVGRGRDGETRVSPPPAGAAENKDPIGLALAAPPTRGGRAICFLSVAAEGPGRARRPLPQARGPGQLSRPWPRGGCGWWRARQGRPRRPRRGHPPPTPRALLDFFFLLAVSAATTQRARRAGACLPLCRGLIAHPHWPGQLVSNPIGRVPGRRTGRAGVRRLYLHAVGGGALGQRARARPAPPSSRRASRRTSPKPHRREKKGRPIHFCFSHRRHPSLLI